MAVSGKNHRPPGICDTDLRTGQNLALLSRRRVPRGHTGVRGAQSTWDLVVCSLPPATCSTERLIGTGLPWKKEGREEKMLEQISTKLLNSAHTPAAHACVTLQK